MTIIQIYIPIIATEEGENDYFYGQVQFEIEKKYKQDVLLVAGNWNAKMGNIKEENVVGL